MRTKAEQAQSVWQSLDEPQKVVAPPSVIAFVRMSQDVEVVPLGPGRYQISQRDETGGIVRKIVFDLDQQGGSNVLVTGYQLPPNESLEEGFAAIAEALSK